MCENGVRRCPIEEVDPEYVEVVNGVLRPGMRVILCDTCIDQIRVGYRCLGCHLRVETAFPEACPWCGYGMREHQADDFAERFGGERDTRSQIDWDGEYERLARQRHEREVAQGLRSRGLLLPRGVG